MFDPQNPEESLKRMTEAFNNLSGAFIRFSLAHNEAVEAFEFIKKQTEEQSALFPLHPAKDA